MTASRSASFRRHPFSPDGAEQAFRTPALFLADRRRGVEAGHARRAPGPGCWPWRARWPAWPPSQRDRSSMPDAGGDGGDRRRWRQREQRLHRGAPCAAASPQGRARRPPGPSPPCRLGVPSPQTGSPGRRGQAPPGSITSDVGCGKAARDQPTMAAPCSRPRRT